MEAYLEERRNITDPFHLTHTYPNRPITSPFARMQIPKRKKTKSPKKRSRKVNHQASRKQYKVRQLEEPFLLSNAPKPTFMLASAPTTNTATTTMVNLSVSSKLPSTLNIPSQRRIGMAPSRRREKARQNHQRTEEENSRGETKEDGRRECPTVLT